ncbi:EamA family transporter RarD [Actinoalloteichus sp. AHMU CJ021]|uniref:EamA family transporter RarD n=1 Tax=Actinoalloteichus TaxID=65496 RepID=UPI00047A5C38|nr:EamA family transporter RarD [Actinoalloteichus caeruleus]AUS79129.1 EamA family transporter RarD [Actinoalloteichus sp. AHMU CJ021]
MSASIVEGGTRAEDSGGRGGGDGTVRSGTLFGVAAYLVWGVLPAFWALLAAAGSLEVLAHRLLWTFVMLGGAGLVFGWWRPLRTLPPRQWAMVLGASALITVNWGLYVIGVQSGQTVDVSLGYFINPLVSVLLGMAVLRERLRPGQWVALAIGFCAVLVLTVDYGQPPVLAVSLAITFGLYGLLKKTVTLGAATSVMTESALMAPLALGFLVWAQLAGVATFVGEGVGHALLLVLAGPATAVPLLLFNGAARRIPLTLLGMLQYLAPTLMLVYGLVVDGEPMSAARWSGFGIVWLALLVFTVDSLLSSRRTRRRNRAATAALPPV